MTQFADSIETTTRFETLQDVIDSAPTDYTDLSYHNLEGHINPVLAAVPVIINWATRHGINDIPQKPLEVVMATHDAGVHISLEAKKAPTDEIHSAQLLLKKLNQFRAGREIIELAIPAVVATTPYIQARNNFQLAARMLDVGNVCSEDFALMLEQTRRVIREEELELKSRITSCFEEKRDKISKFLEVFYFPGIVEFVAEDGSKVEYEPARIGHENVRRLASLSEREFIELVPEAEDTFAEVWKK